MVHFIVTNFLYWTRYQSIAVTLKLSNTQEDYNYVENSYFTMISFAIFLLLVQFFTMAFNFDRITFRAALTLGLNVAAIFFVSWIALEGLSWDTYTYVFIFCILFPVTWDFLCVFPYMIYFIVTSIITCWRSLRALVMRFIRFTINGSNYAIRFYQREQ